LSRYDWLLFFHVTGAFLLVGGAVIAGALNIAALRSGRRPSEILLLFGLIRRIAVPAIGVGTLLLFVFGLWLVHEAGYGYSDGWIVTAIVLLILGNAIGGYAETATGAPPSTPSSSPPGRRTECGAPGARPRPDQPRRELRQRPDPRGAPRDHDLEAGGVMLASIRPDSWNLPLFLHVLGATILFGATATIAIAASRERARPACAAAGAHRPADVPVRRSAQLHPDARRRVLDR
jgi:uncharacterized membrane protein